MILDQLLHDPRDLFLLVGLASLCALLGGLVAGLVFSLFGHRIRARGGRAGRSGPDAASNDQLRATPAENTPIAAMSESTGDGAAPVEAPTAALDALDAEGRPSDGPFDEQGGARQAFDANLARWAGVVREEIARAIKEGPDRIEPAVLARAVQEMERLQILSIQPVRLNSVQKDFLPMLEKSGWSRNLSAPSMRLKLAGADSRPPAELRVTGWAGPGGALLPAIELEPAVKFEQFNALLAALPVPSETRIALKPGKAPIGVGEIGALLACAGLLLELELERGMTTANERAAGGGTIAQAPVGMELVLKAKEWRNDQLSRFRDAWEAVPPVQPRMVVMEVWNDTSGRVPGPVEMTGLRSKGTGVLLPPARVVPALIPDFHASWEQTRKGLAALGAPSEEVAHLSTLECGLHLSWFVSHKAPDVAAGRRHREQMALAWARLLIDVRARELKRRLESGLLTPATFDGWNELMRVSTGDLGTFGWRVGSDQEMSVLVQSGEVRCQSIVWPASSLTAQDLGATAGEAGPGISRWLRPPVLPMQDSSPSAGDPPNRDGIHGVACEAAVPTLVNSSWQALIVDVIWGSRAQGDALLPAATALLDVARRIEQLQGQSILSGAGSELKKLVADEYWLPLYRIADQALGLAPASTAKGQRWLAAAAAQLCSVGLGLRQLGETDPSHFAEASADEPQGRPALVDEMDSTLYGFGLRPATNRSTGKVPSPAPPPAAPPTAAAKSTWHAPVVALFSMRSRLLGISATDDQQLSQKLLETAGAIDRRQRERILELADGQLKAQAVNDYWVPLYDCADACFGFSRRALPAESAARAWLASVEQAMGSVQLRLVSEHDAQNPAWFRGAETEHAPPGRPAVVDAASGEVLCYGISASLRRAGAPAA